MLFVLSRVYRRHDFRFVGGGVGARCAFRFFFDWLCSSRLADSTHPSCVYDFASLPSSVQRTMAK